MSGNGAATVFNRESLGIFFLVVYFKLCIDFVSAQEAATALNRKKNSFFLFVYINFMSTFS